MLDLKTIGAGIGRFLGADHSAPAGDARRNGGIEKVEPLPPAGGAPSPKPAELPESSRGGATVRTETPIAASSGVVASGSETKAEANRTVGELQAAAPVSASDTHTLKAEAILAAREIVAKHTGVAVAAVNLPAVAHPAQLLNPAVTKLLNDDPEAVAELQRAVIGSMVGILSQASNPISLGLAALNVLNDMVSSGAILVAEEAAEKVHSMVSPVQTNRWSGATAQAQVFNQAVSAHAQNLFNGIVNTKPALALKVMLKNAQWMSSILDVSAIQRAAKAGLASSPHEALDIIREAFTPFLANDHFYNRPAVTKRDILVRLASSLREMVAGTGEQGKTTVVKLDELLAKFGQPSTSTIGQNSVAKPEVSQQMALAT